MIFKTLKYFITPIKKHTVLIAEPNVCHFEVIPGYIKYFRDLGFNVNVLLSNSTKKYKIFELINDKGVEVITVKDKYLKLFLSMNKNKEYEYILFTSHLLFVPKNGKPKQSVLEYFDDMVEPQKKVFIVEHRLEEINQELLKENRVIVLADFKYDFLETKPIVVNPHYFGDVKIIPKSDEQSKFIIVGEIAGARRNFWFLIDNMKDIINSTKKDFKISIVSKTPVEEIKKMIPQDLRNYFELCGALNYNELFKKMGENDYFLPLLDNRMTEHERYITIGTSGSFQLIYGFAKPCLIHTKFAGLHGFNNDNSFLYNTREEFVDKMKQAIELSGKDYKIIQDNLVKLKNEIYDKSLNNLKNAL